MEEFNKYETCKDCPDRAVGCHSTCEGYKHRCQKQKELNDYIRATAKIPTEHYAKAKINVYKKQKKLKGYKR